MTMPRRPKGSGRDSAAKNTFNPPASGASERPGDAQPKRSQTHGQFEQDAKRRIGQFGGAGEPPLMKK
jgi:hypothetical protein